MAELSPKGMEVGTAVRAYALWESNPSSAVKAEGTPRQGHGPSTAFTRRSLHPMPEEEHRPGVMRTRWNIQRLGGCASSLEEIVRGQPTKWQRNLSQKMKSEGGGVILSGRCRLCPVAHRKGKHSPLLLPGKLVEW